jgi:hypothetical protein
MILYRVRKFWLRVSSQWNLHLPNFYGAVQDERVGGALSAKKWQLSIANQDLSPVAPHLHNSPTYAPLLTLVNASSSV